jgi:hypothetical protein
MAERFGTTGSDEVAPGPAGGDVAKVTSRSEARSGDSGSREPGCDTSVESSGEQAENGMKRAAEMVERDPPLRTNGKGPKSTGESQHPEDARAPYCSLRI